MKKCEICNKEIDKDSPFNTDKTHGKCVYEEIKKIYIKSKKKENKE